ncbi:MAG: hypothetical protein ACLSA6_06465 [Holdemania massiliensis]
MTALYQTVERSGPSSRIPFLVELGQRSFGTDAWLVIKPFANHERHAEDLLHPAAGYRPKKRSVC